MKLSLVLLICVILSGCTSVPKAEYGDEVSSRCTPILEAQTNCRPYMFNASDNFRGIY